MADKIGKILYTQDEILKRAKEIAAEIDKDYAGEDALYRASYPRKP